MRIFASTLIVGLLGMAVPLAAAHAQVSAPILQAGWHHHWHHGWHGRRWHHWHHWHHHWAPPPRVYGYYAAPPPVGYAYGYVYTN